MDPRADILKEIEELSPLLAQWKAEGRQPFRVPEGYFEQLPEAIFRSMDSGLAEIRDKQSFAVPENYFENLTDQIMERVEAESVPTQERKGGRTIQLGGYRNRERLPIRRLATVAAAIALFLTLGIVTLKMLQPGGVAEPAMAISQEEAYEYIQANLTAFESEDLYAMLASEGPAEILNSTEDLDDAIDQYLLDNIDDFEEYLITSEI